MLLLYFILLNIYMYNLVKQLPVYQLHMYVEESLWHKEVHCATSSLFFQEIEVLIPETIVCLSKGSSSWAPSISQAVRYTSAHHYRSNGRIHHSVTSGYHNSQFLSSISCGQRPKDDNSNKDNYSIWRIGINRIVSTFEVCISSFSNWS